MSYLYILCGGIAGAIITSIIFVIKNRSVGVLKIDHNDPKTDKYRFDVPDLDILDKKHRICLKVDNHADLSHE